MKKTNNIENKDKPHQNKEWRTTRTTVALMKAEHQIAYYRDYGSLMKTNHIENKDKPHHNKELPTTGTTIALMKADHIRTSNCLLLGQRQLNEDKPY